MIKVVSWNVNSLRKRLGDVESLCEDHSVDVLLLQETKVENVMFPIDFFKKRGYAVVFAGQKAYNGVAIASRFPIEDVRINPFFSQEARCIGAKTGGYAFCSVYVPQGQAIDTLAYKKKLLFLDGLWNFLKIRPWGNIPHIVGGDMNVALTRYDVCGYDMSDQIMCSLPERRALRKIMGGGWCDALWKKILTAPDSVRDYYTWWSYKNHAYIHNQGWRIDMFLLCPHAVSLCNDTGVYRTYREKSMPSDHAPIWIQMLSMKNAV